MKNWNHYYTILIPFQLVWFRPFYTMGDQTLFRNVFLNAIYARYCIYARYPHGIQDIRMASTVKIYFGSWNHVDTLKTVQIPCKSCETLVISWIPWRTRKPYVHHGYHANTLRQLWYREYYLDCETKPHESHAWPRPKQIKLCVIFKNLLNKNLRIQKFGFVLNKGDNK